ALKAGARAELLAAERRLPRDPARRLRPRTDERQPDRERRPLPLALALDLDRAAVQLDDVVDDREPETQAAVRARVRAVGLPEGLEDVRQELGRDPLALVADGDDRLPVAAGEPQDDAAAPGGELDRVREEVPHDLLEAGGIALDPPPSELEDLLDPNLLRLGVGAHRIERRLGDGREIDRPGVEDELPGRDARHVQEVLDQLRLRHRTPLDRLDRARGPLRVELAAAQQAR